MMLLLAGMPEIRIRKVKKWKSIDRVDDFL